MAKLEWLVGADAFWRRAAADCAEARRRLLVQAMTFEGDDTGLATAAAIGRSAAADRRVLVDAYSRVVVSDRWVGWPNAWLAADLRREKEATSAMFESLVAAGVAVRVTNPISPLMANYPARNHKKLIIADDAVYVGGVNFSDHNFRWRDFMLRLEDKQAADFLAADFEATWSGRPAASTAQLDGVRLMSLDGRTNDRFFDSIAELLAGARREIVILSAYLTFPFTAPLAAAAARGVVVRLITPWANNKPLVRDYLLDFAYRSGFEVRLLPDMSHLKAMLIDGRTLVVGSCNFDFVGHAAEEELAVVIDLPEPIGDFERLVIGPALAAAEPAGARRVSPAAGRLAHGLLGLSDIVVRAARHAPRTAVDWS